MSEGYRWSTERGLRVGPLPEAHLATLVELGLVDPSTQLYDEHDAPLGRVNEQPEMIAALARAQLRASVAEAVAPWRSRESVRLVGAVPSSAQPPPQAPPAPAAPPVDDEAEVLVLTSKDLSIVPPPTTPEAPPPAAAPSRDLLAEPVIEHSAKPSSTASTATVAARPQAEASVEDRAYAEEPTRIEGASSASQDAAPAAKPSAEAPPAADVGEKATDGKPTNAAFDAAFDPWADGLLDAEPAPEASAPAPAPAEVQPKAKNDDKKHIVGQWVDDDVFSSIDLVPVDVIALRTSATQHLQNKDYRSALRDLSRLIRERADDELAQAERAYCQFMLSSGHADRVRQAVVLERLVKSADADLMTLVYCARTSLALDRHELAQTLLRRINSRKWDTPGATNIIKALVHDVSLGR